jgi:transcriptional regulator with XRE-family HTH domain
VSVCPLCKGTGERPKIKNGGERARQAREELGVTQTEMAEDLGIPISTIHHYENGDRHPSIQRKEAICSYLGIRN